jgi:predicted RNA-binding Zn-ribbon protein involved in translation (DUF1610 family)
MAVELVLRNWCDVCLEAGVQTPGETVSVDVTGTAAFDVETCPEHGAPLAAAIAVLAALGRRPGKTGQAGPVRASKATAGASSGPSRVTGGACPECGQATNSREALRSHLRREHDKSLADVGLAEARYTCPECGGKFDAGQGFSAHLRAIHNGLTMADALARSEQSA